MLSSTGLCYTHTRVLNLPPPPNHTPKPVLRSRVFVLLLTNFSCYCPYLGIPVWFLWLIKHLMDITLPCFVWRRSNSKVSLNQKFICRTNLIILSFLLVSSVFSFFLSQWKFEMFCWPSQPLVMVGLGKVRELSAKLFKYFTSRHHRNHGGLLGWKCTWNLVPGSPCFLVLQNPNLIHTS